MSLKVIRLWCIWFLLIYIYIYQPHVYRSPFSSYSHAKCFLLSSIIRSTLMHQMTPKLSWPFSRSKVCHIHATNGPQIWLHFALRPLVFPDNWAFSFRHRVQWWIWIFDWKKSLKIRNSRFQKSQTQFCEDHWPGENSGEVSKGLKISLPLGLMLLKKTKYH